MKPATDLKRGDLLSDDEYRQLRYGLQETYTVSGGEDAVIRDGEAVTNAHLGIDELLFEIRCLRLRSDGKEGSEKKRVFHAKSQRRRKSPA